MSIKRVISTIIILVLLVGTLPINVLKTQAATSGYYTYTVTDKGTVTINDCSTSISGTVTIPSTLGGYPVTCIGEQAFYNCDKITKIIIPDTVQTLYHYAFESCDKVKEITIAESVTFIGWGVFRGCGALTSIVIPDSVTFLGNYAFEYCSSLSSVKLGNNVPCLGDTAFLNCTSLTTLDIPDSVTYFGNRAFQGCSNLKEIKIGKGLDTIYTSAFDGCKSLKHILLPDGIVYIYHYAFQNCSQLETISLPNGIETIPEYFFKNCVNLSSIRIPDGVTSIENHAFVGCNKLNCIIIPNSVTSIHSTAFAQCNNLVIYCETGSYAETFAIQNNFAYVAEEVLDVEYDDSVVKDMSSIDMLYQELAVCAPEYLDNSMAKQYISINERACFDVVNDYSNIKIVQLAMLEGFVNGTEIISNKLLSFLGVQSTGDKWIEESTLKFLQDIEHQETVIYDSWKAVNQSYKDLNFVYKSTEVLSKAELVRVLTSKSQHLSSKTINSIVDTAFESIDELGIEKAFDATEKAFDIVDLTVYSCQLYDVQMETIERLLAHIPKDCTLYEGLIMIKEGRETNAADYVISNFLKKEIASKLEDLIGKFGKYATTQVASIDVSAMMSVVTLTLNMLYNYVYQGAKVSDINETIILSEFYNSISIALADEYITILNNHIQNQEPSQEVLDDYKWFWDVRLACLGTYADACINIAKYSQQRDFLNDYKDGYYDVVGFENYIVACHKEYKQAVVQKQLTCLHYRGYKYKTVQATCSENGYTVNYCMTCNNEYVSEESAIGGHSYICKTVPSTCTKQGYTIYTCQSCRHSYKTDFVDCIEHVYSVTRVPSTCNTKGYTEYRCTGCNSTYLDDYIEANGHSYGEWTITSHATPETVGSQYTRCSTCSNAVVVQVPKIASLAFTGASLTLQNNLTINYKVSKKLFEEVGYTNPYVQFVLNGKEYTVTAFNVNDEHYIFDFRDIAPHCMNDTIYATLYATYNNVEYSSETREYSVAAYCNNMLQKYDSDAYAKFRTLLVDLLNYGTKSQEYMQYRTDNLVSSILSEEQAAWGTKNDPVLETVQNTAFEAIDTPTVFWKGAGLNLKESVGMRFKIATDSLEDLTVKVKGKEQEWIVNSSECQKIDDGYYVYFDKLNAGQMRETIYLTVYKGQTPVSNTVCYSIESYAYAKQNSTDANLAELVKAMMKYGDSAKAYIS